MRSIVLITKRLFCDLNTKNKAFARKIKRYQTDLNIHQKASDIDVKKMAEFVVNTPK